MEQTDKRFETAKERLSLLTNDEIQRIISNIDLILFDTYNFYEGKFCPIAIAMDLPKKIHDPTDEKIKSEIAKRFNPVNIFKGIKGEFYTENRKEDLLNLCKQILKEREK